MKSKIRKKRNITEQYKYSRDNNEEKEIVLQ